MNIIPTWNYFSHPESKASRKKQLDTRPSVRDLHLASHHAEGKKSTEKNQTNKDKGEKMVFKCLNGWNSCGGMNNSLAL